MNEKQERSFLSTAVSMGHTGAAAMKVFARAISGDYVGAAAAAARSPFFRKMIAFICAGAVCFLIIICSLPAILWNSLTGGEFGEYSEAQFRILNMAQQINGVFLDDYIMEQKMLREMGIAEDDMITKEPIPPISPYKIMAYFCVSHFVADEQMDNAEDFNENMADEQRNDLKIGTHTLTEEVERYRELVALAAMRYQISEYTDVLLAIMQQESGGRGADVMQAAASGYVEGAVTPESSIDGGVHYFAECLEKAQCSSPQDWSRLEVAVQAYNYGTGYISWLAANGYSGWTAANAAEFSGYMLEKYQANGQSISRYGDKQYLTHVFRYYHESAGDDDPIEKIDIANLLTMLRKYEGEYYYNEAREDTYEILFITNAIPDYFSRNVFSLTEQQIEVAETYEAVFERLGNVDFISSNNALGQQSNLNTIPLTNSEVAKYMAVAKATDAQITMGRTQVLMTGLSLVGKVGYFWGGKYNGVGWNEKWGEITKVTAAGDRTTGTYQPLGLDCSGFVDWAYRTAGASDILQNGGTWYQYHATEPITSIQLRPGDLGFIVNASGRTTHVGIFIGIDSNGKRLWVHSQGGTGVCVSTCSFTEFRKVID